MKMAQLISAPKDLSTFPTHKIPLYNLFDYFIKTYLRVHLHMLTYIKI